MFLFVSKNYSVMQVKTWHIVVGWGQIIAGKRWRRARLLQPPQPQTPAVSSDASLTEKSRIQTSPGTFLSKWLASSTFSHLKQCSRASSHEASIHPTFISWEEQAFAWINRDIIMFAYMTVTIFFLFFFWLQRKRYITTERKHAQFSTVEMF